MAVDGVLASLMVGMGETYFPAFALAIGTGQLASGLITTVPLVAGALLQMRAPAMLQRVGSHRRWVVGCAALQALSFMPLLALAFSSSLPRLSVFAFVAVYWAAGLAATAAWNTWAETLVPMPMRAPYFARRSRLCQAGMMIGFLAGGLSLQLGSAYGRTLGVFALVFATASASRLASVFFLSRQSEPIPPMGKTLTLGQWLRRLRAHREGRLLAYLLALQAAVQISGPFFSPYMLAHLRLPYFKYVLLVATSYLAKVVALSVLGHVAQRRGALVLLRWGGFGIVPLSALWLVSTNFSYLLMVQIVSGVFWAAYELGMFLMFFDSIKREERTSVLTLFNLANALAMGVGSLVGGVTLMLASSKGVGYATLFALSSAMRLLTVALLLRVRGKPLRSGPKPAWPPPMPSELPPPPSTPRRLPLPSED